MSTKLAEWNAAPDELALEAMLSCCGARRWAEVMIAARPIASVAEFLATADRWWNMMAESDWLEAFACHPRIGEQAAASPVAQSAEWSRQEQQSVDTAREHVLAGLAQGNARYEELFGFTYIVCATGKTADQMLAILQRRLGNDRDTELREAAEQQRQIMRIRLGKWLTE